MSSNFIVYKITNTVNQHEYVGSTTRGLDWRKRKHLRELKNGKHHNRHLLNAFGVYGLDTFVFTILEELDGSDHLLEREDHWTKLLKPVYNILKDGLKIKSHIGVKRSAETCRRISESLKGRKLSTDHVESMRKTLTGRKQPRELAILRTKHQHKPIIQKDLDGNLIKCWKSATCAEQESGGSFRRKAIFRCLWGDRRHYKGFLWERQKVS